jgi:CRISPR-associated endoribonuclease Cas6
MTLSSFQLYLRPTEPLVLRGHTGRLVNGLVYYLLREINPDVANEEHPPVSTDGREEEGEEPPIRGGGKRRVNGFTASLLQGAVRRDGSDVIVVPQEIYRIRLTTLHPAVYETLGAAVLQRMAQGMGVGLGIIRNAQAEPEMANFQIERLGMAPLEQEAWLGNATYEQLWNSCSGVRKVTLRFASPTAFQFDKIQMVLPSPYSVFNSLLVKWNTFAPTPFQLTPTCLAEADRHIAISRYELKTDVIKAGKFMLKGFTGWVEYDLKEASSEVAHAVEVLARYALYAGVGKKTTQGMGQVRME